MQNSETLFADLIIPVPLPSTFTYRVPRELNKNIKRGQRVIVNFGKTTFHTAIVFQIHTSPPEKYQAQYILDIIDKEPIINESGLQFWEWIWKYYMATPGDIMNAALPSGLRLQSETKLFINDEATEDVTFTDNENLLLNEFKNKPFIQVQKMKEAHESGYLETIRSLIDKGILYSEHEVSEVYKPKYETYVSLHENYKNEAKLKELFDSLEKRAPPQFQALLCIAGVKGQIAKQSELVQKFQISTTAIAALAKKKIIVKEKKAERRTRNFLLDEPTSPIILSEQQNIALSNIKKNWEDKYVCLLKGPTASGKTYVYGELIRQTLEQKKQSLILLPEVALTAALIDKLNSFFNGKVAVFHSKYSTHEKTEIWKLIENGEILIVLSSRMGIFLPFNNLGLVVVDEEHENTFKQSEKSPRYQARDAALMLARLKNAKVLLSSATPSVETWFNVQTGLYGLVELNEKYHQTATVTFITANITEEKRIKTFKGFISQTLYEATKNCLENGQQVIFFQNRKGFVPITECNVCAWVPRCTNCDITLTYHKYLNVLKCHYCGFNMAPTTRCPTCNSHDIKIAGYGTERIQEEMELLFPEAKIERFDQESTRNKDSFQKILQRFEEKQTKILIGTQLVVKGLDFENVGLAAVIDADQLLHFPDFRAKERTYQLISQLAGRVGRGKTNGKVIVQTHNPENVIFELIAKQNFESFYQDELKDRHTFKYPPFHRLIKIFIRHTDYKKTKEASDIIGNKLRVTLTDRVLGPESPPVGRIKNMFIKQILIKSDRNKDDVNKIKYVVEQTLQKIHTDKNYKGIKITIDVDPY